MLQKYTLSNLADSRTRTKLDAEKQKHAAAEAAQTDALAWLQRMTPVPVRVERFLATVPDAVKAAGLPMQLFKDNLKGRYRGQVNTPDVGKALRALGWVRVRNWSDPNKGYNTLWYAPDAPEAQPRQARSTAPTTPPTKANP